MKTPSIRNILVPIDFSAMSIRVIDTAKGLAQRFGATVHLAHAHEFFYPAAFSAPASPVQPYPVLSYDKATEEASGQQLIEIAKQAGLSPVTTHILRGSPAFDEICRFAKQLPADLIVMPTHGRTGLKHVVLGSTAERIVQHSPCPVYVARNRSRSAKNGADMAARSILVPVDFSRCSLAGAKYAMDFAEKIGAKMTLLHVVAYHCVPNAWMPYELTEATRSAKKEAEQQMCDFVRAIHLGGVRPETDIISGNTVDKISDYAGEHDVDLIITSTHGRTGLKHVLMGSVAENVVRRAPCSVLAVPSFPRGRTINIPRGGATRPQRTTEPHKVGAPYPAVERAHLTRKYRKLTTHPFPERRKTNRFREGHLLKSS